MKRTSNQHVLLIHGLAGCRAVMWPLVWHVRRAGFATSTFGYSSFSSSIERHAMRLNHALELLENDPHVDSFHIVSHSMGGIVVRKSLGDRRYKKLKRLVMLAPPNHGSHAASALSLFFPFSKPIRQISKRKPVFVNSLSEPDRVEVGVIAGNYDFVIPKTSSHLECEADHVMLFSGHNGLLVRPAAARRVVAFLRDGKFFGDEQR